MFTIEHEFDASVITLVDEGEKPLREDVIITVFDDQVLVEQHDDRTDRTSTVTLSMAMLRDLRIAFNLPEGTYRLKKQ